MSFDPNPQPGMPSPDKSPFGAAEAPKSSKKWWFMGCGGCLLFVLLICGGGGAFVYVKYMKPFQDFLAESMEMVKESPAVQDALGTPIEIGAPGQPETNAKDDQVVIEYQFPISGPKGEGTLVLKTLFDLKTWERQDFYVEVDGEQININEGDLDVDIDMGGGD